jgi:hypothetical protein
MSLTRVLPPTHEEYGFVGTVDPPLTTGDERNVMVLVFRLIICEVDAAELRQKR